jgi:glycosyltransferase involved in cell wall biosynthesis
MNIFIVIPAFNEEKRIGDVIRELNKFKLPIIVVDDGSTDNTLSECQMSNVKCQILRHKVNLGKGAAMKTGAEASFQLGADAVVFIDSDGQHKSKNLPNFIKALKRDKFDVVFGSRNLSHGVPLVRYLGNKFASLLVSFLFGIYVSDFLCGYRAVTKDAWEKMDLESTGYAIETEMVIKTKKHDLRHCEVPVETVYYDEVKGVTILDAFSILFEVLRWRIKT